MNKLLYMISAVFILIALLLVSCVDGVTGATPDTDPTSTPTATSTPKNTEVTTDVVTITDKGNYFFVEIDYTKGNSHWQIGKELGKDLVAAIPDVEALLDSYISELLVQYGGSFADLIYTQSISRVNEILPQVPQEYRDEMEGVASQLSFDASDDHGDNKISENEYYMLNLLTDVARMTECAALSVYGSSSETGKTMTGRLLDWEGGVDNQLPKLQAVTYFKNGDKSFYAIGYAGVIGVLSGFNDNKIFAAILDSGTGRTYSSLDKRSYVMDLRYALENETTLNGLGAYLTDSQKEYTFGHLMILSDENESKVLENDLSNDRVLRTDDSILHDGVTWGFTDAVGTVNSFLVKGNVDNHTNAAYNTARWSSMTANMTTAMSDNTVTYSELKDMVSFDNGDGPGSFEDGDIYGEGNQQIILFKPDTLELEIAFHPKDSSLPSDPVFESITVSF